MRHSFIHSNKKNALQRESKKEDKKEPPLPLVELLESHPMSEIRDQSDLHSYLSLPLSRKGGLAFVALLSFYTGPW